MVDHDAQSASSNVVRRKLVLGLAAGARLAVTQTTSPPLTHASIVFVDLELDCRCGNRLADNNNPYFGEEREPVGKTRSCSSFFHARNRYPTREKKRAGFYSNYRSGVDRGIRGGVLGEV